MTLNDKINLPFSKDVNIRARINMVNSILDDLISHVLNREQVTTAICDLIKVEIELYNKPNTSE